MERKRGADPKFEAAAEGDRHRTEASHRLPAALRLRLHFSLARQLMASRRERHLTQKQLADLSGIDQAEISRIERGQANPTVSTLSALTRALDVDVELVAR